MNPSSDRSKEVSAAESATRKRVVLFLAFLTSDECRQACHAFLAPEKLAFELARLWFDEIYVPGTRYLDGLKGDRSEEAARRFQASFSQAEQAALERFHRFFELRTDMLTDPSRERAAFPQDDLWRNIVKDASYVLEELEADPDTLRSRLAWIVQTLARRSRQDGPLERTAWRALFAHEEERDERAV